jgi:GNAT superfamily N-acetyltransferase
MLSATEFAAISFIENGHVDVVQLNALYRIVGWDNAGIRSAAKTREMLAVSRYHIAGCTPEGVLAGFARVCGDPYVAQVLDVITHPDLRGRGIATRCMRRVVEHLRLASYASVTLTDGSGLDGFYEQFGFRPLDGATSRVWVRSLPDS